MEALSSSKHDPANLLHEQQTAYQQNPYPALTERLDRLATLRNLVLHNKNDLIAAISEDYGYRSATETLFAEIISSLNGIDFIMKNLKSWMKPSKRRVSLKLQPARAWVEYQPLGVVGIMVPWNYPLYLTINPAAYALAAGNHVLIKMSEFTPRTGELLNSLFQKAFPDNMICLITGGIDISRTFSSLPFNHLLFTGSSETGKKIMSSAAENLTPVTLELGGKSPAILTDHADWARAIERIAFAKCLNAGQTCIAPDYILLPEHRNHDFTTLFQDVINRFYPDYHDNKDYSFIINDMQFQRLNSYLKDAEEKGAQIFTLGQTKDRRLAPTILLNVTDDMLVMQNEIFGPLLPVISYKTLEEAITYISSRPQPLALYLFSNSQEEQYAILRRTHSGGICFNDALFHIAIDDLPFGGIGASGMGQYHGIEGFYTFSKAKPVLAKSRFNNARLLYPPYGSKLQQWIYKLFLR